MRFIIAVAVLTLAQPCNAQAREEQFRPASRRPVEADRQGWSVTVGVAPVLSPAWQGSRDMVLSVFPDLRVSYGDRFFASIPEGLGWNALNQDGWKAGPVAKLRFGRDEDRGGSVFRIAGGSDALVGLGNVDAAAEIGGFLEKRLGSWRARMEVLRGFGGHEGVVAEGSVAYQMRSGRTIVNAGPRLTLASKDFVNTYFGVDAVQAQRSGLPIYTANGGLLSYGVGGSAIRPLGRRSALTLFTGLDRLGDAAGKSSLVRERGRRTQFTIGLGYGFRFNI